MRFDAGTALGRASAAQELGRTTGRLEVGYGADPAVLAGDPLADLTAVADPSSSSHGAGSTARAGDLSKAWPDFRGW